MEDVLLGILLGAAGGFAAGWVLGGNHANDVIVRKAHEDWIATHPGGPPVAPHLPPGVSAAHGTQHYAGWGLGW